MKLTLTFAWLLVAASVANASLPHAGRGLNHARHAQNAKARVEVIPNLAHRDSATPKRCRPRPTVRLLKISSATCYVADSANLISPSSPKLRHRLARLLPRRHPLRRRVRRSQPPLPQSTTRSRPPRPRLLPLPRPRRRPLLRRPRKARLARLFSSRTPSAVPTEPLVCADLLN